MKYGDDINTDLIIPGKYLHIQDPHILATYALNGIDSSFPKKAKKHPILAVGNNFGCGSSREQAVICLKFAGVRAIIAQSMARILFRNAINLGIIIVESSSIYHAVHTGCFVDIDLSKGRVFIDKKKKPLLFSPLPRFFQNIIESEGLIPYLNKLEENKMHDCFLVDE